MTDLAHPDAWQALRRHTPARIALGRVGHSLPTAEVLRFGLAHALAQDAVHRPLDTEALCAELQADGWATICAHSRAPDREQYLMRPDLGRRLAADTAALLRDAAPPEPPHLVFVLGDGLSPLAVERHAPALLRALRPRLPPQWRMAPVVVVRQARVAVGDEVGELWRAKMVAVLIGERPGLSSPDSLGVYVTHAPVIGRHDAERNCISNVRPEGLPPAAAAAKLAWLVLAALKRGLTGVQLKDDSELSAIEGAPPHP